MTSAAQWTVRALVDRLGGHPAAALGLDLARDADVARWLVAACLLSGPGDEARATEAWRALAAAGWPGPQELAGAAPRELGACLERVRHPRAERAAHALRRCCAALVEGYGGSPGALAAEAESLEELGARVARLGPGVGAATVARFLRPLRELWPAALELPLDPAARAAAVCLGLLAEGQDEEGEPGALRAALRAEPGAPSLADAEAALARLGRLACLRGRPERCPLGTDCPRRQRPGSAPA
jgi:endonuclease III